MIYSIRSVVAGISKIEGVEIILDESIKLAKRLGAKLHLVHAFEHPRSAWDTEIFSDSEVEIENGRLATLRSRLEQLAKNCGAGSDVFCHVTSSAPATALSEVVIQESADLVLVGATRKGPVGRSTLGTTAGTYLQMSNVPTLVVRKPIPPSCARILTTSDLGRFSAGVHELGLDVIDTLCGGSGISSVEIRALLVAASYPFPTPDGDAEQIKILTSRLEAFLNNRRDRGSRPVPVVRLGDPAHEIATFAGELEPDYLVLGSHARKGIARWLLGSVAESAAGTVHLNVLLIPWDAEVKRLLPIGASHSAPRMIAGDVPPWPVRAQPRPASPFQQNSPPVVAEAGFSTPAARGFKTLREPPIGSRLAHQGRQNRVPPGPSNDLRFSPPGECVSGFSPSPLRIFPYRLSKPPRPLSLPVATRLHHAVLKQLHAKMRLLSWPG